MINVKLIEMRKVVREEVDHIPRGGVIQNLLRQVYVTLRMNSLSRKPKHPNNRSEILRIAIKDTKEYAKKQGKKFTPVYDRHFFRLK